MSDVTRSDGIALTPEKLLAIAKQLGEAPPQYSLTIHPDDRDAVLQIVGHYGHVDLPVRESRYVSRDLAVVLCNGQFAGVLRISDELKKHG